MLTIIDKNDTDGHCPAGTLKNIVGDKNPIKCACHKNPTKPLLCTWAIITSYTVTFILLVLLTISQFE